MQSSRNLATKNISLKNLEIVKTIIAISLKMGRRKISLYTIVQKRLHLGKIIEPKTLIFLVSSIISKKAAFIKIIIIKGNLLPKKVIGVKNISLIKLNKKSLGKDHDFIKIVFQHHGPKQGTAGSTA